MKRIGLISDTHGTFDDKLRNFLKDVDEIWHAGDIGSIELSDNINAFKPLKAVYGNCDGYPTRLLHHEYLYFVCEGVSVVMTHIGGYPHRYSPLGARLIEKYHPRIFISGHSHILKVMNDPAHQLLHINPGAAGCFGFHTVRTAVRFTLDKGQIKDMEVGEWAREEGDHEGRM